ncbi:MAG: HD domain-containing protein [Desulfobulbus sp.]|nr:HD domain-containing protein [Desulfobulbus sp.]
MPEIVLVVDDDEAILEFAKHVLSGLSCQVVTLNDPVAALDYLGHEEVAVLVTDNNMPVMCGLELIEKANIVASETVKIIMSAYADLSVALCAINQCQVFKFVPKPWKPEEMADTVIDALQRHRTLQTLRRENEDVLRSLAQTIELKDPCTRGHCDRVATVAVQIAKILGLSIDMQREIKYGGWLHDCGKIGVPEHVLNANRKLEADEYTIVKNHSVWGADVARKANLSAVVVNVILCHHERYDGTGYPNGIGGEDIPIEARIVSIADVFDALVTDRPYRKGLSLEETLDLVISMKGKELDPFLVDLFINCQAYLADETEQQCGEQILIKESSEMNRISLRGDYSITGVKEQIPFLAQHLARVAEIRPSALGQEFHHEIDFTEVQVLDTCGCQLLAALLRNLRELGIEAPIFKISDTHRERIHLLGFDVEIFAGEYA